MYKAAVSKFGQVYPSAKLEACGSDCETRLHVYWGDAVPVSNVGLNKATESGKDEEADQPSSSKGSEHPTSD